MRRSGRVQTVYVTKTASLVLGGNPRRVAVVFFPPLVANGECTLSTEAGVASGAGLNIVVGTAPVVLRVEDVGDAITRDWYGVLKASVSSTETLSFIETYETN